MLAIFDKLNLKLLRETVVINLPPSLEPELAIDDDWSALRFRRAAFIKVAGK